jgi:Rrf2 family protein
MRFSTRSEYGIRVMVRMGRGYGNGRPLPLNELAEQEGLPLSYLEQIAAQLRRAGLITSRMGVKGGYSLARSPQAITMADIVRSLEGSLAPVSCLAEGGGPGECTHADTPCSAHAFWEQLQSTITSTLQSVSVADLMREAQPA